MDKKGQVYIVAAIILCVVIYGLVKIYNKVEVPGKDDFDFFVENFKGERSNVINLGYIQDTGANQYLDPSRENILSLFTEFGWSVGVINVFWDNSQWKVVNYMDDAITICYGVNCVPIAGAQGSATNLEISFGAGKRFNVGDTGSLTISEVDPSGKYFSANCNDPCTIKVGGAEYTFDHGLDNRIVRSIIFKDIDENYVRIMEV